MFGGLGVLAGTASKWFCIPLSIRLHDGLQSAVDWEGSGIPAASHVIRMVEDAHRAATVFGKSLLLLDRYFLCVPALERLAQLNSGGATRMEIVTKAKSNCVAYEAPPVKKPGRGRPPKKGMSVKLMGLFTSHSNLFQETVLNLYGKEENVRYYCTDLLWGQKLYQPLRFVLVEYRGTKSILVSTSLSITPEAVIRLYSYRFRIECCFRELKQQIGCFCYHFWTKSMPKLNRFRKKSEANPLEAVTGVETRDQILKAVQAIECHVLLSTIAMGLLQMGALRFSNQMDVARFRYLRTPSLGTVSEATIMCYLRQHIFRLMAESPNLCITRIIAEKQEMPDKYDDLWAS